MRVCLCCTVCVQITSTCRLSCVWEWVVCVAALCLGFIGVLMPCQIDRGPKCHVVSLMVHVVSHLEFDRLEAVAAL